MDKYSKRFNLFIEESRLSAKYHLTFLFNDFLKEFPNSKIKFRIGGLYNNHVQFFNPNESKKHDSASLALEKLSFALEQNLEFIEPFFRDSPSITVDVTYANSEFKIEKVERYI